MPAVRYSALIPERIICCRAGGSMWFSSTASVISWTHFARSGGGLGRGCGWRRRGIVRDRPWMEASQAIEIATMMTPNRPFETCLVFTVMPPFFDQRVNRLALVVQDATRFFRKSTRENARLSRWVK